MQLFSQLLIRLILEYKSCFFANLNKVLFKNKVGFKYLIFYIDVFLAEYFSPQIRKILKLFTYCLKPSFNTGTFFFVNCNTSVSNSWV